MDSYRVSSDGRSITCHRCGLTSFSLADVANRYCGLCHVFHNDPSRPLGVMWVIYDDSPSDHRGLFVARFWIHGAPTSRYVTAETLNLVRLEIPAGVYAHFPRSPDDDPVIVETWIRLD